jgi:hypothetical protein
MKKVIALFAISVLSTSIISAGNCSMDCSQLIVNSVNNAVPGYKATLTPVCTQDPCNPCKEKTMYAVGFEQSCAPCDPCAPVCNPCGF